MIGIAIAAVGIKPEVVRRCYRSLSDARITVPYRVHVQTECEPFSRSAARNRAILQLIPHCDKIVCLDVDCLVPPGLIELADQHIRDRHAIWTLVRKVAAFDGRYHWDQWKKIRTWPWGTGAFVGMTTADWLLVGGWDERLTGWGSEDDVLAVRRRQHGIETLKVTGHPLVHVDHEYRGRDMEQAKKNRKLGEVPPPKNYLAGRLPIDAAAHQLFLWPTARCQHACPRCSQGALMRRVPDYQMPLGEIDAVIDAVRNSGYPRFRKVILAGGETLL